MDLSQSPIAVVGLGYVGLPIAVEFGRKRTVVGFDVNDRRVAELNAGLDRTGEVDAATLADAAGLSFTADIEDLRACRVFIVAVPTPVDAACQPDLTILASASRFVGSVMSEGAVVIYESTVYPGCTRQVCAPILEAASGLKLDVGFHLGYSPERINPGDKAHRLPDIVKVTSGSTPEAAEAIDALYASIVTAGTHRAPSIEVAEAAKVIENTQRDVNIALMNELAILFARLDLDTGEVLAAARTKWNFLPFRPGLVGGHCIGVDPYYLTHRAQTVGYHPEVILSGRRINDRMGTYVAEQFTLMMLRKGLNVVGAKILVLGLTFKEDCPDTRNSRVFDILAFLKGCSADVHLYDPVAEVSPGAVGEGVTILSAPPQEGTYDGIIVAVSHREFVEMGAGRIRALGRPHAVLFDVKGIFDKALSDARL